MNSTDAEDFFVTDTVMYRDISERTNGDIYVGVVGPVRTGKSTLIRRMMEELVLPNIADGDEKTRARDEMPQSAGGKTVMTTEPKFVPDKGVRVTLDDGVSANMKLIDCVGYLVPDALGGEEDGDVRMVHTPWHDTPVPFEEAAEYGTRKVIADHATVGLLVTTDGSIGEIPRESYVRAEERVAKELSSLGKPFVVVLNSAHPESAEAAELGEELEKKYSSPVALVNCTELNEEDIWNVFSLLLDEFPVKEMDIALPAWTAVLPERHELREAIRASVGASAANVRKLRDARTVFADTLREALEGAAKGARVALSGTDAGRGSVAYTLSLPDGLYYDVISSLTGIPMHNEAELLSSLRELSAAKKEMDRYRDAIREVNETGYGIVMPNEDSLSLEEPEIISQAGSYGVKLKASATSIHMIRTSIDTEISPMVGTEAQSEELVNGLLKDFGDDPASIWESNLFGRSLYELVSDGICSKLGQMPTNAREKFAETLSKVINEGSQGLICIIL